MSCLLKTTLFPGLLFRHPIQRQRHRDFDVECSKHTIRRKRKMGHWYLDAYGQAEPSQDGSFDHGKYSEPKAFTSSDIVVPVDASYLKRLKIKDFILVKDEVVEFDAGFNVVTGESGAGKSVLIEALNQVLGKTSLGDCIRSSCSESCLEGVFHLSPTRKEQARSIFNQYNVPSKVFEDFNSNSGIDIILKREIVQTPSGLRSRCFVNAVPTSVRVLRAFADVFFDVNGQHSVTRLGDKETQLMLIDQIARLSDTKIKVKKAYNKMIELKTKLDSTSEYEDETTRERAHHLCQTIENEKLIPGEETDLRYALQVLETHASSVEMAKIIVSSLNGQGTSEGIISALHTVASQVKAIIRQEQRNAEYSDVDDDDEDEDQCEDGINCAWDRMDDALHHLDKAENEIDKAVECVEDFASMLNFDVVEQMELRQRLKKIEKLLKDFDCSTSEQLLDLAAETEERLQQYHESNKMMVKWEAELATVEEEYIQRSVGLSSKRREASGLLRKAVEDCLFDLAMKTSRFDVRVNWERATEKNTSNVYVTSEMASTAGEQGDDRYAAYVNGLDSVEFLLAAGPAEPLRSLSGVASGGESARIMLAFKAAPTLIKDSTGGAVLKETESNASTGYVYVLDELDTGVGGRLGLPVGRLLTSICTSGTSAKNQVICVSHLPQVAASANNHIKAVKFVDQNGNIEIKFHTLTDQKDRSSELNEMMGTKENVARMFLSDDSKE